MTFSQRAVEAANAALRIVKSEIDRMGPNDAAARTLSSVVRHLEICVTNIDGVALQGWQPIESAPKDGTRVLLWSPAWLAACSASWYGSDWRKVYKLPAFANAPTHWMPLPPPPAGTEE